MARDVFIKLNRCQYCNRPGFVVWDRDLFTCGREVCKALAFAEVRRRHHDGTHELPERRLARALLASFDTFDYAVRLDQHAELLKEAEGEKLRASEREKTALLLSELRDLSRRYPAAAAPAQPSEPEPETASPRYRRFVSPGRTVALRRTSGRTGRARA